MRKLTVSFIDFTWDTMPMKKSVMEHAHLGYEPDVGGERLSGQYSYCQQIKKLILHLSSRPVVKFSSDYEKRVFEELTKVDTELGNIYYAGLLVLRQKDTQTQISENTLLENISDEEESQTKSNPSSKNFIDENPDRIAQSAHSMRELVNVATRRHPRIMASTSKLKTKSKFQKIADPQTDLPDFLQSPYGRLTKLHKFFTKVSHHEHPPSEQEYLTKVEEFTFLMNHILTPHYEVSREIEELIEKPVIEKKDLEKLESLMSRNSQSYKDFFTKAKANWLEILVEDGKYFKNVPPVIKNNNSYSAQSWPESYFLERIASEKPELVQKIILQIPIPKKRSDRNWMVLSDFVGAALKMPPKTAKAIAEKAITKKWLAENSVSYLVGELAKLMVKLAETEFETFLNLCDSLLEVTLRDVETSEMINLGFSKRLDSVINRYYYEQILKDYIPILHGKDHDAVIQILAEKLSKANNLASKTYQEPKKDPKMDTSFVWRPAIEEHEQNSGFDLRSHLVASIRRTLEKSESLGIDSLKKSLRILDDYDYYIFRRLEIYFYGRHPAEFNEEVDQLSIEYFGKYVLKHEYYHMLKNCYPCLKSETREEILGIISKGPNFDDYSLTKEEFETYKKIWRMEKLSPIIEYLPDLQDEYDSLVKQHGRSDLIEFAVYHESSSQMTYTSDLSEDMTVTEVIDFIKSYDTPQGIFLEEDGSGRVFKEMVEHNPEEYSRRAIELLPCHGLFHFRFLNGLSETKDKKLDWDAVLTFCESVIITSPSNDIKILDSILDYVGDLLRNNLVYNKTGIPFALRDRLWNVLSKAIEMAPTDTTWSENYLDNNWNAHGISINSSIGRLCHAVIQYALWCYHELKEQGLPPVELVPEVKSTIESMLSIEQERSISIYAVLGHHFPQLFALDEKWAKSKISLIFTHDNPSTKFGDAAWDAYVSRAVYPESFNVLFDEYVYRISHPAKRTDSSLNDVQKQLAQQIGLIYFDALHRSGELFEIFLDKSDPRMLEDCLDWIGRSLKDWKGVTPPKMDVFKFVSYPKIRSHPSAGWLFLNPSMPKSERIRLLGSILDETEGKISPIYWIPEELEKFAEEYPYETIECVNKIVKQYQTNWEMHSMGRYFGNIFPLIIKTGHASAIAKMRETIHFLGSLGYHDFKEFLG